MVDGWLDAETTVGYPPKFRGAASTCVISILEAKSKTELAKLGQNVLQIFAVLLLLTSTDGRTGDNVPLLDSKGLYINFWYREAPDRLLCGSGAESMVKVHLDRNLPLSPTGEKLTLQSNALLGIFVSIRGSNNVQKDLLFRLRLILNNIEKIYEGLWKSSSEPSSEYTITGRHSDWWIPLEDLFSPDQVNEICSNKTKLRVQYISHKFLSR